MGAQLRATTRRATVAIHQGMVELGDDDCTTTVVARPSNQENNFCALLKRAMRSSSSLWSPLLNEKLELAVSMELPYSLAAARNICVDTARSQPSFSLPFSSPLPPSLAFRWPIAALIPRIMCLPLPGFDPSGCWPVSSSWATTGFLSSKGRSQTGQMQFPPSTTGGAGRGLSPGGSERWPNFLPEAQRWASHRLTVSPTHTSICARLLGFSSFCASSSFPW